MVYSGFNAAAKEIAVSIIADAEFNPVIVMVPNSGSDTVRAEFSSVFASFNFFLKKIYVDQC